MCLLAMNSLHSDNHKLKKKEDKEEEKNLLNSLKKIIFKYICAAHGYHTQYLSTGG